MKPTSPYFYDLLGQLYRKAKFPTMRNLADRTGLSHSGVHAILTGASVGTWASVAAIIDALGGDLQDPVYFDAWTRAGGKQGRVPIGATFTPNPVMDLLAQLDATLNRIADTLDEHLGRKRDDDE